MYDKRLGVASILQLDVICQSVGWLWQNRTLFKTLFSCDNVTGFEGTPVPFVIWVLLNYA